MKTYLLAFLFCLLVSPAWGATWTTDVTQAGGGGSCEDGGECSVAEFNALSGDYSGSTFNFSGSITTKPNLSIYGTSGSPVVLDGWSGGTYNATDGNHTNLSSLCTIREMELTGVNYITVQDFEFDGNGSYSDAIELGAPSRGIIIHRNYIHDHTTHGVFHPATSRSYYVTIGGDPWTNPTTYRDDGNEFYEIGEGTDGYDIKANHINDLIIAYNKMWARDPSGGSYTRGVKGVSWGNYRDSVVNVLVEGNYVYNHRGSDRAESGLGGKGGTNVVYRYNYVENHYWNDYHVNEKGIGVGWDAAYVYIYGNYITGNSIGIYINRGGTSSSQRDGVDTDYVYVWANIVEKSRPLGSAYKEWWPGILIGDDGSDETKHIYIRNNTIYQNPSDSYATKKGRYSAGIAVRAYADDVYIDNNLLVNNGPDDADNYQQVYIEQESDLESFKSNLLYHSDGTATVDYGGQYGQGLDEGDAQTTEVNPNTLDDNSSAVTTDSLGGMNNPDNGDHTLRGDAEAVGNGADLGGYFATVTVQGHSIPLAWDDALHPDTDWTTIPPTVKIVKQESYGSWEQGAYIYDSGTSGSDNTKPVAIIVTPAADDEVDEDDSVTLDFAYTDADGDTCTYIATIPAEMFKEYAGSTAYGLGAVVEDPDAGDSGDFYRCKVADCQDQEPPNASYWEDAETTGSSMTGTCDTAGVYVVGLKVNDGTVDSAAVSRTITVNDPGGGASPTTEIWSRNTTGTYTADYTQGDGAYIWEDNNDLNLGTSSDLKVEKGLSDNRKILLSFDLTDINGETVTGAVLGLYLNQAPDANINLELWSCTDAFVEAEATWDIYSTGNSWTGTHGETTFLKEVAFTSSSSTSTWYTWESNALTSYIGTIASGGSTAYLLIKSDANQTDTADFNSDDTTDGTRPYLQISYGASDPGSVPVITGITCDPPSGSDTANGSYTTDDTIGPFHALLSEACDVTGTPVLTLDTDDDGANDATSNYSSGTGTKDLTFAAITVTANHGCSDLDAIKITTTDAGIAASDDAEALPETADEIDTIPTGATVGSLAYNHAIVIDVTPAAPSAFDNACTDCDGDAEYSTADALVRLALETDTDYLDVYAAPGYPRIANNLIYKTGHTYYLTAVGLCSDDASKLMFGVPTVPGLRTPAGEYLEISGNIDTGEGGKIQDEAGNDITATLAGITLAGGLVEWTFALPWTTAVPGEFGVGYNLSTMSLANAGSWYPLAADILQLEEDQTITSAIDWSAHTTASAELDGQGNGITVLASVEDSEPFKTSTGMVVKRCDFK